MWQGRYNRDEKSPISRAKDACTAACVRSERGACTAESVSVAMEVAGTVEGVCCVLRGQEQLGFGCGTVTSTAEAPTDVCAILLLASQSCCAVVGSAVDSSPAV